jgi:DNA-directed RNA polymerase subunit RPC12/RpoP
MIKFKCKSCGQKLSVPESRAGKKGRCPKCKNIIVVPKAPTLSFVAEQSNSGNIKTGSKSSADNLTLQEVIQKDQIKDLALSQPDIPEKATEDGQEPEEESPEETESIPQRKLPWFIDIFLYPLSAAGLTTLGIIIIIPLLINIAIGLLGPFGLLLVIPGFVIRIVIGLYYLWYIAECIRDSAEGGIRAPETMANAPGLSEMFWQWLRILVCWLLFVGPAVYYYVYTDSTDTIYWSLVAFAVLFLPMSLLAVVMFDSLRGINPLLVIGSIFSTFFQYCGLILILGAVVLTTQATRNMPRDRWLAFISGYIGIYLMLVVSHLLGRFYWRYEEKLNWDV